MFLARLGHVKILLNLSRVIKNRGFTPHHFSLKSGAGFTLIETLLYIGLFGIIIGGSVFAVYQLLEGSQRSNAQYTIAEEANFVLRKVHLALNGVSSGDVLQPPPTGSVLQVSGGDEIRLTGGRIYWNSSFLTSENVTVSSLEFEYVDGTPPRPDAIKVSMTINGEDFESIKYLRQ